MILDNWLAQRAQTSPERTALIADGSALTFAELEVEASSVARRLAGRGARRGATVALSMAPGRDAVILLHALMKLGAVALPLDPRLSEAEQNAILEVEQPALVVTGPPPTRIARGRERLTPAASSRESIVATSDTSVIVPSSSASATASTSKRGCTTAVVP